MKLHFNKKLNLGGILFVLIAAIISILISDTLKPTRLELKKFYVNKLNDCQITNIRSKDYPSRGTYLVFSTNCSLDSYPIFLDNNYTDTSTFNLFQKGTIISKDSNSLFITLNFEGKSVRTKLRNPKSEDDRWESIKIVSLFFSAALILVLIIPNRLYAELYKNK